MTLNTPISESDVRSLKCGDKVLITGTIFTARDSIHKYLYNENPNIIPFDLNGGVFYHCGPIIKKNSSGYTLISGGPTTSIRLEMYTHKIIKEYGIRVIIGKGGMGDKTLKVLHNFGCIYLQAVSGAAVYLANRVEKVLDVCMLDEFGEAEAMWKLQVKDFPVIVTMDTHNNSLYDEIRKRSILRANEIYEDINNEGE